MVNINIPGVAFTGTFGLSFKTIDAPVHETFQVGTDANGDPTSQVVDLPATGQFLRVEGTNIKLTVAGQTLRGSFSFEQRTLADGTRIVLLAFADVALSLGGSPSTDAQPVPPDALITLTITQGAALIVPGGLAARLDGALTLGGPLQGTLDFVGPFHLSINTTTLPVHQNVTVGGMPIALDLPAGPYLRIAGGRNDDGSGSPIQLNVLGQTLEGNFTFEQMTNSAGQTIVRVGASGVGLDLGGGVVRVTGGQGSFVLAPDGIAGDLAATVALNLPGDASFEGQFRIALNQTNHVVNQSLNVGGQTLTLNLPAGPYLRVEGQGITLHIAGQTLGGDFAFERVTSGGPDKDLATTANNVQVIRIGAANVHLSLGSVIQVTQGQGTFLIVSGPGGGMAGQLSANVALTIPGVTFNGAFGVAINNMTSPVDEVLEVGGQPLALNLPGGPYLKVTVGTDAAPAALMVAGQTLSGVFAFEQTATPGLDGTLGTADDGKVLKLGVTHFHLGLGDGTTDYVSVTQNDGQSALFVVTAAGLAGSVTASVDLTIPGLAMAHVDAITVALNNTTAAVHQMLDVGGAPVTLDLPAGPYLRVDVTNFDLTILGQTLRGNFSFEQLAHPRPRRHGRHGRRRQGRQDRRDGPSPGPGGRHDRLRLGRSRPRPERFVPDHRRGAGGSDHRGGRH